MAQPQTIRSLAGEFLVKQDVPCHIDDVVKYIESHRTCTKKGLLSCITNNKQFIRIRPGYLGLESKTYNLDEWRKQNVAIIGTMPDLAEHYLTGLDTPCHVGDIAKFILKFRACTASSLMSFCSNDKRFTVIKPGYLGLRVKKYDLKKWEKENIGVFGSIPDLAGEFCAKHNVPCHIDEIAKYVLQYRESSPDSIMSYCCQDRHKRFFQINLKYLGLRAKTYDLVEWNKQFVKKPKSVTDFAEIFLAKRDTPHHIHEIVKYVSKYRKTNAHYIMQRISEDSRFFTIKPGYAGLQAKTYNLEEWRKQNIAVVGKFGDLIEEYLAKHDVPCHIDEIVRQVKKARVCTASSLMQQCRTDKRFSVIKFKYVILRAKKYDLLQWAKQTIGLPGSVCDMAEDFLSRRDTPCHVNEITPYITKYSNYNAHNLMFELMRNKRFIRTHPGYVGLRAKKYDLKKWRKQTNVAFSIRYFMHEFLAKREAPSHISEIARYIAKYRRCTGENVRATSKRDKRFLRIKPGYIGLHAKKYNLKEWKSQNVTTFGKISDVAAHFVAGKDFLCPLKSVAKYVMKYRNTSAAQVMRYVREDARLIVYTNGYIGFWGKDYDDKELGKQKIVKGGTVEDIAEQFITRKKAHCTIDEITDYVSKCRKVNAKWILGKIKEDSRFRVLKNGNIGLRAKNKRSKKVSKIK